MSYQVEIGSQADAQLAGLDAAIGTSVERKIQWSAPFARSKLIFPKSCQPCQAKKFVHQFSAFGCVIARRVRGQKPTQTHGESCSRRGNEAQTL